MVDKLFLLGAAAWCFALMPFRVAASGVGDDLLYGYPVPRRIAARSGELALPPDFSVSAPPQLAPALADLRELCSARGLKLRHAGNAAAFLVLELSTGRTPEHPQGYLLEVGERRVVIASRTPEGLFNGLQTLRTMMIFGRGAKLPLCRITDWPSFERRAVAFSIHRLQKRRFNTLKKQLCALAALKYNRVTVEFGDNFPFASPLFPGKRENLSAAEIADLLKFARDRFIEVVPMLRIWTNCPLVADRSDGVRMLENPQWGGESPYCPLKPELLTLLGTAIGEQCALIRPRDFVFYLDREGLRRGFRLCPECRGRSAAELVSGHLKALEEKCSAAGVNAEFILDRFDRTACRTGVSTGKNPRSCVTHVGAKHPNMPGCASAGEGEAIGRAAAATFAAGGKDFTLLAFKSADQGRIVPPRKASPWFFGDAVNAAAALWNPEKIRYPADPVASYFRIYRSIPAESDFRAVPVPLGGALTAELSRTGRFPLYRGRASLETLREQLAGCPEKFRLEISPGGRYYGILLSGASNDGLRSEPVTIRLGAFRAPALALLLSCTPPLQQAEYDPLTGGRGIYEYGEIATVTLNYTNGKNISRPLRYMVDITDWNRRFGGYALRLAAAGVDSEGNVANWWSFRLVNPHPEWPLESMTFATRRRGGAAPVLLALSMIDAADGKLPPAPKIEYARLESGKQSNRNMPKIVVMDFENAVLAPATVELRSSGGGAAERPEVTFPADPASPSGNRVLKIRIPAMKNAGGNHFILSLNLPGQLRGSVRSLGLSCRIDHPEYLGKAFQELADTHSRGTYRQRIYPGKKWSSIWTALGNPDRDSRNRLRDPHRSNMRRIVFCFRELPEPVTIWIDDISHSRLNRHTLPYQRAEESR